MYRPGHDEDVPAPFDPPRPPDEDEEAALLPEERIDATPKSSKRSVVLVGGGEYAVVTVGVVFMKRMCRETVAKSRAEKAEVARIMGH